MKATITTHGRRKIKLKRTKDNQLADQTAFINFIILFTKIQEKTTFNYFPKMSNVKGKKPSTKMQIRKTECGKNFNKSLHIFCNGY